jgi:hypothetical protein
MSIVSHTFTPSRFSVEGTHPEPDISNVDDVEGVGRAIESVEDIPDFEPGIMSALQSKVEPTRH